MSIYPAVDSNTLTYLLDAIAVEDYDPATDISGLADERRAMVWCYFYGNCSPWVSPTVQREYNRITAPEKRERHDRWTKYLLQDKSLTTPQHLLEERAEELLLRHGDIDDCRVVAETEAAGLRVLLSVDRDLRVHLQPHTSVRILRPTDFW